MCYVLQVSGIELGPGLYFSDGKRKVDYVLCYRYKKRRASKSRLSITSNGSLPMPVHFRMDNDGESGEAGATGGDIEEQKLTEEEKALMREEFEAALVEAGLQLERDKEVGVYLYSAFILIIFSPVQLFCRLFGTYCRSDSSLSDVTLNPITGEQPNRCRISPVVIFWDC